MFTFDMAGTVWDDNGDAWPVSVDNMPALNLDSMFAATVAHATALVNPVGAFNLECVWQRREGEDKVTGVSVSLRDCNTGEACAIVSTVF